MAKITEQAFPGQTYAAHIHARGCADLKAGRARGMTDTYNMDMTGQEWLEDSFGDIASDEFEPNTPEWDEELRYQASEVIVKPCAKAVGFTF